MKKATQDATLILAAPTQEDYDAFYGKYAAEIDAAQDEADVRRVLRKLQGDRRAWHAVTHALNARARERKLFLAAPSPAKADEGEGKAGKKK